MKTESSLTYISAEINKLLPSNLSKPDLFQKVRLNGERVLYDLKNNVYGVFTKEGTPKTLFKPDGGCVLAGKTLTTLFTI